MDDFARPISELRGIDVASSPTFGKGLSLAPDGKLPTEMQLIRISTLTSGTSFTASPLTRTLFVECIGGGGGGGGCATTGATQIAAGGGGGGGAYSSAWLSADFGVHVVGIGAGGTGVANSTGNTGGDTSFKNALGTVVCLAKGGTGGAAGAASTPPGMLGGPGSGGAAASGTGDAKLDGGDGFWGQFFTTGSGSGGVGGAAAHGGPSVQGATGSAVGNAGKLYGGGGSGGANGINQLSTRAGGAGAAGLIRVWEFI